MDIVQIANAHRRLAAFQAGHQAAGFDPQNLLVGNVIGGDGRHVADAAITEARLNVQLLFDVRKTQHAGWVGVNFDADTGGGVGRVRSAAFVNPVVQDLIGDVVLAQFFAADMGDAHRRLAQQQAVRRSEDVDAPVEAPADQVFLVLDRIIGEHGQHETALALRRTVTGAGVAALPRYHRQCFVLKADRIGLGLTADLHRHLNLQAAYGHRQQRFAIGLGPHHAFLDRNHFGSAGGVLGLASEVADFAVLENAGDD